ncbi:lysoplasmalogenase [Arthrobacter sp. GMC3]|uniref:lysoplasmalogenase n=1 Tax=Arthrobacter sp. GMC3 TaxID=2058894 RepID=UPI002157B4FB|nr:lysoplasmalogenase [Arthrobacter sp. GMC3]
MSAVLKTPPITDRPLWWGFVPYILVSAVHVTARFMNNDGISEPSKLLLMPALLLALLWIGRRLLPRATLGLLVTALLFSWLGDGAGTFFPFAPTLPLMLLCFGVAHLCYMRAFWRHLAVRALPWWSLVIALWWVLLLILLWHRAGGLAMAVAAYGIVLGGTAALATRCHPVIMWGGLFFLTSDTILAFRIFAADLMPPWTSGAVMLTYVVGQGLIVAGALIYRRRLMLGNPQQLGQGEVATGQ